MARIQTRFISHSVVERYCSTKFVFGITVPDMYKKYLFMPPSTLIDDKDLLQTYMPNPETYLWLRNNNSEKIEALEWLLQSGIQNFFHAGFTAQTWVRQNYRAHCLSSLYPTKSLCVLSLNAVGIKEMSRLPNMPLLQELDISLNDIQEIDFEPFFFQNLKLLTFGSNKTKFLTSKVLSRMVNKGLSIWVPGKFRKYLMVPFLGNH